MFLIVVLIFVEATLLGIAVIIIIIINNLISRGLHSTAFTDKLVALN
jgi:hypothetical protein